MSGIICTALTVYILVLIARIILSWVPIAPVSPVSSVASVLFSVTEPVLGPLRKAIPPVRLGGAMLDLSPLIVFFGIQFILLPLFC